MAFLSVKAICLKAATGVVKVVKISVSEISAPVFCVIVSGVVAITHIIYNSERRLQGHGRPFGPSWSSFPSCGEQMEAADPAPVIEDQRRPRPAVEEEVDAAVVEVAHPARGTAIMFLVFGLIASAAIGAVYMSSKENRSKNENDNVRLSLHSNYHFLGGKEKEAAPSCQDPKDGKPSLFPSCQCPGLGGTEEEAGTASPCLDTSTRCKIKVTEEKEGSAELPFKSTDTSQKILEELQSLKSQMSKKDEVTEGDLKLEFRREMKMMKQLVAQMTSELKQLNAKVQMLEEMTDKMDRARQRELDSLVLPEVRGNKACLRFRAIPEQPNENIREITIEILTTFLERQSSEMDSEVNQVYRVNSSITTQRNLPRDVIVHFVRKQTRDQVLQQHYEITLKTEVKDMVVLKEIPERILHSRKEYGLLADKLKKILLRMERSEEMTFTFEKRKFQVNSTQKAEDFLHKYKKELEETGELGEEESEADLEQEKNKEWKRGEHEDDEEKICSSVVDFSELLA